MKTQKIELVDSPDHYKKHGTLECIVFASRMDFMLGNAFKYIWRDGSKSGNSLHQDLEKAMWYVQKFATLDGLHHTDRATEAIIANDRYKLQVAIDTYFEELCSTTNRTKLLLLMSIITLQIHPSRISYLMAKQLLSQEITAAKSG